MAKLGLALAVVVFGCGGDVDPGPGAPLARPSESASLPAPSPGVSAPFDVASVIRQVGLAFRAEGRGFRGDPPGFAVQVAEGGAIRVTPSPLGLDLTRRESAPLELETGRIGRGGAEPAAVQRIGPDGRGELDLDRRVAIEHLRNSEEGLEQSWRFASAPPGHGDLVVRVRVRGQGYAGTTPSGLHFVDDQTGVGVRYGHAVWIDGAGTTSAVPVRFVRGAIEMRVPADRIEGSVYPALLDPVVSPELGLDQPYVPSPGGQTLPDVASDGSSYLVVWESGGVVGARVTASGTVLDPLGIRLDASTSVSLQPAVAWEGTAYLVVWHGVDLARFPFGHYIEGARVAPSGARGDTFRISAGDEASPGHPVVTPRGPESLVVWEDSRDSATTGVDLYGARIAAGGGVMDAADLSISTAPANQSSPDVASNGTDYLVAWTDRRDAATASNDVYAVQVGAGGAPLGSEIPLSTAPESQSLPAVSSNGAGYVVVWSDRRDAATSSNDLYGARVSAGGVLLGPAFSIATGAAAEVTPDLAWDGTSYLLAWAEDGDVHAARMSAVGVADLPGVVVSDAAGTQRFPRIAVGASGALVTWEDQRSGGSNVYAARVADGAVLDPEGLVVSTVTHEASGPAVATNGTDYLVVWEDSRGGGLDAFGRYANIDLWGVRVDASGQVLDPGGIAVSTAASNQLRPVIASNGSDYLVSWYDYRRSGNPQPSDVSEPPRPADVFAARVTADGSVLEPDGIAVAASPSEHEVAPAVASDGADYLVVWYLAYPAQSIQGARVSATGAVVDSTPIPLAAGPGLVNATFDGINYVAVWQWTGPVVATRVSPAGVVLDPRGITVAPANVSLFGKPAVASSGGTTLLAWEDGRVGGWQLYGARLAGDGSVLDPGGIALSALSSRKHFPTLAWNGAAFLAAWEDWPSHAISGTYVLADGTVLLPDGFAISPSGSTPALASLPGTSLLAYRSGVAPVARLISPDECDVAADCPASPLACVVEECLTGLCSQRLVPTTCLVAGICYGSGAASPSGDCQICLPERSQRLFTMLSDGTACAGGACFEGDCLALPPDGGSADASLGDARPFDASTSDTPMPDAPTPDALTPDASVLDAPPGAADGAASDGQGATSEPDSGCGCHLTPHGPLPPVLPILLLFFCLTLRGLAPPALPDGPAVQVRPGTVEDAVSRSVAVGRTPAPRRRGRRCCSPRRGTGSLR